MCDSFNESIEKSRSQKKRESSALQSIGEKLSQLPLDVLAKIGIQKDLFSAIAEWQSISSREGKRRQMQFIGKLMRTVENPQELDTQINEISQNSDSVLFQYIETVRAELLHTDESKRTIAIEQFCRDVPNAEEPKLKHFISTYFSATQKKAQVKVYRELFRYLRKILEKNDINI